MYLPAASASVSLASGPSKKTLVPGTTERPPSASEVNTTPCTEPVWDSVSPPKAQAATRPMKIARLDILLFITTPSTLRLQFWLTCCAYELRP